MTTFLISDDFSFKMSGHMTVSSMFTKFAFFEFFSKMLAAKK